MKKFTLQDGVVFIIWLVPIACLMISYQGLPSIVPTHFGIDGKPDKWGDKSALLFVTILLMVVAAIVYLLMKFLPQIDPKRKAKFSISAFNHMGIAILVFISAINIIMIYATKNGAISLGKMILPLVGIFLSYVGNIMYSIKPNYFVGIRTPWTLEDEATWRKTHQLGGKLWLVGGICITIVTLLLPPSVAPFVFISVVAVMALIPVIYSYIYFKKHKAGRA